MKADMFPFVTPQKNGCSKTLQGLEIVGQGLEIDI